MGTRTLNANHLAKLEPILNKYGYMEGLYTKARVIAVINHKGGVGKTTTTSSLGAALASRGFRVLLVDLDPQGNLSQILGVEQPESQVAHALLMDAPLPVINVSENLSLAPSDLELADAEMIDGIILTRVDRRLVIHKEIVQTVRQDLSDFRVFNTEIRLNAAL